MFHKFVLRPKSIAESALRGHFSPSERVEESSCATQSQGMRARQEASVLRLPFSEPLSEDGGLKSGVLTMQGDETMKNALREAMLGPSVLLLALSAISTGSSCQAAPHSSQSQPGATLSPQIVLDTPTTPAPAPPHPPTEVPAPAQANPGQTAPMPQETAPTEASPFAVTAKAVQTAPKAGEVLELVIEVKNTSDTQQILHFTSGKRFDFQAFKAGEEKPVWTWSEGRVFTMMLRDQILEPGQVIPLKAKWPAPPQGKFTIQAIVTANGGLKAAPFDVVIE